MARRRKGNKVDGWVNLDKPIGLTSTQAMAKVRKALNAQKAGHAGTLDPLASGVLPIALGEATKTIQYVQDGLKTYSFTITWGQQRDTDDAEGDVINTSDVRPTPDEIKAALGKYIGHIEQIPPKFSAIKIDGQRAYDLARDGEEVKLKSREVYIESLELLCHSEREAEESHTNKQGNPFVANAPQDDSMFIMTCGKGTYVRALARDLAVDLGTYGYISVLRREKVGPFAAKDAIFLDKLEEMDDSAALDEAVLPLRAALDDIPALALREQEVASLKNGQVLSFVARSDFERLSKAGIETKDAVEAVAIFQDQPIALIEVQGPQIKPRRIFNL